MFVPVFLSIGLDRVCNKEETFNLINRIEKAFEGRTIRLPNHTRIAIHLGNGCPEEHNLSVSFAVGFGQINTKTYPLRSSNNNISP